MAAHAFRIYTLSYWEREEKRERNGISPYPVFIQRHIRLIREREGMEESPHTITISPLDAGTTELIILNTAQNGTVLTYKVTIIKEADPASTITSNVFGHKIANGYIKLMKSRKKHLVAILRSFP